jgi:F-type H+-transporting ATPase subunit a
MVMSLINWVLIGVVCALAARKIESVPRGAQNFVEFILQTIYGLADSVIGPKAKNYYPLFAGIFFYILFGNLMGIVPGLVSPTSTLNTTAALALIVFIYYNFQGVREHGIRYITHFFGQIDLSRVPFFVRPFLAALSYVIIPAIEIISQLARILSLSVRLFGNILAKELLLSILALLTLVFLAMPNPLLKITLTLVPLILRPGVILLGVLVGLIQAVVFLVLTIIYIAGAVQIHADEH